MMIKFLLLIILFAPAPPLFAEDTVLSWDPSPDSDVSGYQVYHGMASNQYIESVDVGNTTTYTLSALTAGVHYFAVTAYNSSGNNSGFSNEVFKEIGSNASPSLPTDSGGGGGGCTIQSYGGGAMNAAEMPLLIATLLLLTLKRALPLLRRSRILRYPQKRPLSAGDASL